MAQSDEQYRADLGQSTQTTTNGTLVWRSVDGDITFSDGSHAWVLDSSGQVHVRGVNERFLFEFPGLLRNVPVIEKVAAGRGLFSIRTERENSITGVGGQRYTR